MHSSSIACKSAAARPPEAKRSRASRSRAGRRKLPTWSARNGGRDMGSSLESAQRSPSPNALTPPDVLATAGADPREASRLASSRVPLGVRRPPSPPGGEKRPQHRRRLARADAAVDLRRMMAGLLAEEARTIVDGAALGVRGGVIEPAQTSERDRAGAHRARLKRHVKIAADQPFGANFRRGLADDEHFGVRSRIVEFARAVPGARDQGPVANESSADRRFAAQLGRTRLSESEAHRIAALAPVLRQIALHVGLPHAALKAFFVWRPGAFGLRTGGRSWQRGGGWRRSEASMSEETKQGPEVREGQRIAKVMARAGVCSRRDAEAWIAEGRVSVNGKVLDSPAFNVSEADDVRVDGKPLGQRERTRLFLFHKPRGLVTTARDPEGRLTVFEALPPGLPRLVAIGRLDINSEGLLLLTNDGGLARVLELPSTGWLRRYRVRAHGTIDQAALDRLSGGIAIEGVDYLGIEAKLDREQGDNVWITMGLREGKNREIKKVLEHLGLVVNRLIRVSFGPFELGDLGEGEAAEVRTRVLRDQLGAKLAKEASADFDAPLIIHDAPAPERSQAERGKERGRRGNDGVERATQRLPDRGANGRGSERDEASRHAPPKPSTPA